MNRDRPKHRCYEGIPIDEKIPKTHKDEYDWKQYWDEYNKNWLIKWLGYEHCLKSGYL